MNTKAQRHIPKNPEMFEFDEQVLAVFDDMAERSILGYAEAHRFIQYFAQRFDWPDKYASVWDFGTTTGHALQSIRAGVGLNPHIEYCGLDCSEPAVAKTQSNLPWANIYQHDLSQGLLPPSALSDIFPMNIGVFAWTLQFIDDQEVRDALIREAYEKLPTGGALFVLEKYQYGEPLIQELAQDAYISIRRENGYSLEEIYRKSEALRGAMRTHTPEYMESLLKSVGFDKVHLVYRQWCFGGYLAIK